VGEQKTVFAWLLSRGNNMKYKNIKKPMLFLVVGTLVMLSVLSYNLNATPIETQVTHDEAQYKMARLVFYIHEAENYGFTDGVALEYAMKQGMLIDYWIDRFLEMN